MVRDKKVSDISFVLINEVKCERNKYSKMDIFNCSTVKGRYLPFITGILGIVLYRIALMKDYLFLYTDDDQALMWFGTAAASHFQLYEPHFLGQSYGSMVETGLCRKYK